MRPDLADFFRGKRALVTGGLGFIGSHLARELVEAGAEVCLVDSLIPEYGGSLRNIAGIEAGVRVNISDVRDEHSLRYLVREQDFLFNLAGQTSHLDSMRNPYPDLEINCRSQLSILEACRHHNPGVKIVFASTRQIYGRPLRLPVDEGHPIAPVDVNGINKTAGEWYHLVYGETYGVRVSVLRLTNTYGPHMRVRDARQTFLGYWLKQLLTGEELQVFGDGKQQRDFNYVDDAVEAFLLAAAHEESNGRVYNLGHAEPVDLLSLASLLVELNGGGSFKTVPFPDDRKAIDIGDFYADYGRIERELGWQPRVALREGLGRTLAFLREHGPAYWDG
ncbi:MAG: NAD-dependent epimerase/dehydratase family protein [Actinobacteria bacterium]|nr:NAD-dependent epimerase/dehydratase family protein [Actinomycetota bacterium]